MAAVKWQCPTDRDLFDRSEFKKVLWSLSHELESLQSTLKQRIKISYDTEPMNFYFK